MIQIRQNTVGRIDGSLDKVLSLDIFCTKTIKKGPVKNFQEIKLIEKNYYFFHKLKVSVCSYVHPPAKTSS